MIIECRQCADRPLGDRDGSVPICDRDGGCLIAAFSQLEHPRQPERPDWILEAPDVFDAPELDALAVLSDAGLVPALLPAMSAPSATEGVEPDDVFWPVDGARRRVG